MLIKVGGELLDFDSLAYAWSDQTNPENTKILFKVDNSGGVFFIPIAFEDFARVMEQAAHLTTATNRIAFFDADAYLESRKAQQTSFQQAKERAEARLTAQAAADGRFSPPKSLGQD